MKKFIQGYVRAAAQESPAVRFILLFVFPVVLIGILALIYGSIYGVFFPDHNILYAYVRATGPLGHNLGLIFTCLWVISLFAGAFDKFPLNFGSYQGAGEAFSTLLLLALSVAFYAGFWVANIH